MAPLIRSVCPSFPNIVVVVDYWKDCSEGGSRVDLGRVLRVDQTKDEPG